MTNEERDYQNYLNSPKVKAKKLVENLKVNSKNMIKLVGKGATIALDALGGYCGWNAISCIAQGSKYSVFFKAEWLALTALCGVGGYKLTRKAFGIKTKKEKEEEQKAKEQEAKIEALTETNKHLNETLAKLEKKLK